MLTSSRRGWAFEQFGEQGALGVGGVHDPDSTRAHERMFVSKDRRDLVPARSNHPSAAQ